MSNKTTNTPDDKPPKPSLSIAAAVPGWELAYEARSRELVTLSQLNDRLMKLEDIMGGLAYILEKITERFIFSLILDKEEEETSHCLIETLRMSQEKLAEISPALPNPRVEYVAVKERG